MFVTFLGIISIVHSADNPLRHTSHHMSLINCAEVKSAREVISVPGIGVEMQYTCA